MTGLEIVLPPLPTKEIFGTSGYVADMVRALRASGANESQPGGYGLHVNVNTENWKPFERLLTVYYLNLMSQVGMHVAKRNTGFGNYEPVLRFMPDLNTSTRDVVPDTNPTSKYSAAHCRRRGDLYWFMRSGVIEYRAPKASLVMDEIRLAVEYVFAVKKWVRELGPKAMSLAYLSSISLAAAPSEAEYSFIRYVRSNKDSLVKAALAGFPIPEGTTPNKDRITRLSRESSYPSFNIGQVLYDRANLTDETERIGEILGKGNRLRLAAAQAQYYSTPSKALVAAG